MFSLIENIRLEASRSRYIYFYLITSFDFTSDIEIPGSEISVPGNVEYEVSLQPIYILYMIHFTKFDRWIFNVPILIELLDAQGVTNFCTSYKY